MAIPENEQLLDLHSAAKLVRGRTANYFTLYRWIYDGLWGVKLEHVCAGGYLRTSKEAIDRFYAAVEQAKSAQRKFDGPRKLIYGPGGMGKTSLGRITPPKSRKANKSQRRISSAEHADEETFEKIGEEI